MTHPPILTDRNFLLYIAQHYNNPNCHDTKEFLEDARRIKYIKKLITRKIEKGNLKTRLILNHIIVLSNVFPVEALSRILYLKMKNYFPYVKPFLIALSIYQPKIYNINSEAVINLDNIVMNQDIIDDLRRIIPHNFT